MKIFTSAQIHELDKYTIDHEPIKSIDLMERAALRLTDSIVSIWDKNMKVVVFAGPGNNGGDALAVARMLAVRGYNVSTWLFNTSGRLSDDCKMNRERLKDVKQVASFVMVTEEFDPPTLDEQTLVVDGLFGSGLNKPLTGGFASLVKYVNASPAKVVSIDIPSGLMTESNEYNVRTNIMRADVTLTLQQPKLSFLFPENQQFIGRVEVLDIGISQEGMDKTDAHFYILEKGDVTPCIKRRDPFAHKGTMGHALLVAGCRGMAGAAMLAAKACLRAGAGKVTVHTPACNTLPLQIGVPEVVLDVDSDTNMVSEAVDTECFKAMGIGPGLGTNENTAIAVIGQMRRAQSDSGRRRRAKHPCRPQGVAAADTAGSDTHTAYWRVRPPRRRVYRQLRASLQGHAPCRTPTGIHRAERSQHRHRHSRRTCVVLSYRQSRHGHRRQWRRAYRHHHRSSGTWLYSRRILCHRYISPWTCGRHSRTRTRRGKPYRIRHYQQPSKGVQRTHKLIRNEKDITLMYAFSCHNSFQPDTDK